ncbi:MAG: NADH-quinone oxidoreductase subunit J [Propionibacteriaceae bacterium]|jgi:NADH-quinone oxidoreductase subunit J|nr:NADH-quinone oxidoreductase subunit J [Propionibacteriaceae bacterium]
MLLPLLTGVEVTFWICAVLAIAGAVGLVAFAKPVYSALCLALVMICLAVIYASMGAPFLFVVQIIVYTGAVLMLFLFVVMLVGVDAADSLTETMRGHRLAVALAAIGVLALLTLVIVQGVHGHPVGVDAANEAAGGNVEGLAELIFGRYVIAFEATAALLITAAVAAMVLAHPELLRRKLSQFDLAAKRMTTYEASGQGLAPRPASGVFARHNSLATPALLPDGQIAEASLSPALTGRAVTASPEDLWSAHDDVLVALEQAEDVDFEDALIESDPVIEQAEVDFLDDQAGVDSDSASDQVSADAELVAVVAQVEATQSVPVVPGSDAPVAPQPDEPVEVLVDETVDAATDRPSAAATDPLVDDGYTPASDDTEEER